MTTTSKKHIIDKSIAPIKMNDIDTENIITNITKMSQLIQDHILSDNMNSFSDLSNTSGEQDTESGSDLTDSQSGVNVDNVYDSQSVNSVNMNAKIAQLNTITENTQKIPTNTYSNAKSQSSNATTNTTAKMVNSILKKYRLHK